MFPILTSLDMLSSSVRYCLFIYRNKVNPILHTHTQTNIHVKAYTGVFFLFGTSLFVNTFVGICLRPM